MRLVTLASAVVLLASPALAADVGTDSILKGLMPAGHDAAQGDDGSISVGTARGIKHQDGIRHAATPGDSTPVAPVAGVGADASSKPAISLPVLFATGSADLTGAGRSQLDKLGAALKNPQLAALHFRIEGHTDTAGDTQGNQALSERRANAVVDYLATQFGIQRTQLTPVGMGKQGLAVTTPDQTAEPRNRRVVVINLDG